MKLHPNGGSFIVLSSLVESLTIKSFKSTKNQNLLPPMDVRNATLFININIQLKYNMSLMFLKVRL